MFRDIVFSAKQELGNIFMRGIGAREAVLIAAAAIQAMYFIFMATWMPFELRLTISLLLSVVLLAIAKVPIRGKRFEDMLLVWLRGMFRPKEYQHATSVRNMQYPGWLDDSADLRGVPEVAPKPIAAALPPVRVDELVWEPPSLTAVMMLFILILLVGSVLAYATQTGQLPAFGW